MPATAFALVLLAGLIHASWNIAAKKAGGDVRFAAFTTLVNTVVWAPLGLWLGAAQVPLWGVREWLLIAASAVLHSACYIVLLRGTPNRLLISWEPMRPMSPRIADMIGWPTGIV